MPSSNNRNKKNYNNEKTKQYNKTSKNSNTKKGVANKDAKWQKVDDKTKVVGTVKNKQTKNQGKNQKGKNGKKQKFSEKHPKLSLAIKIIIILILLLCVIGAGIVAAIFFGLFGDDFKITKEDLTIGIANSVVVDQDGNVIANRIRLPIYIHKISTVRHMAATCALKIRYFFDFTGVKTSLII